MAITEKTTPARYLLILIAVFIVMVVLYGRIDHTDQKYDAWDLHEYIDMANSFPGPADHIAPPYAFRPLGPYLAGAIGLPDYWNFYILALAAGLAIVVTLYFLLISGGINPGAALAATTLYMFNKYAFGFFIWDYFQLTDILGLLGLVLAVRTVFDGRWLLLALILILSIPARATPFLIVPVVIVHLYIRGRPRQSWPAALFSIFIPVILFVLFRLFWPVAEGPGLWDSFRLNAIKMASPGPWYGTLINAFAPLALVPLVFRRQTAAFFRERKSLLLLLILIFTASLFGRDSERLMAPALVVFYYLLAFLFTTTGLRKMPVMIMILLLAFVGSIDFESGLVHWPDRTVSLAAGAILTILAVAVAIWSRLSAPDRNLFPNPDNN